MKIEEPADIAKLYYALWRGSYRTNIPPHWDDLTVDLRVSYVTVARGAFLIACGKITGGEQNGR